MAATLNASQISAGHRTLTYASLCSARAGLDLIACNVAGLLISVSRICAIEQLRNGKVRQCALSD